MVNCLSRHFKRMRYEGVKGQVVQAEQSAWTRTGGLNDLHFYLFAKLTWAPDYDVDKGIKDFPQALYGPAPLYIISYVEMRNHPEQCRQTYGVQYSEMHPDFAGRTPLTTQRLSEMDELFEKAEQAVAADPATLERVTLVRLEVQ